jgi:hypothetical protein
MHANLGRRAHACIHSTLSLLLIHTQSTWLLLTGPNSTPHGSKQGIGCKNIQQPWTPCQQQASLQHSQAQLKSRGATPPANTSTTFPKAFHPDPHRIPHTHTPGPAHKSMLQGPPNPSRPLVQSLGDHCWVNVCAAGRSCGNRCATKQQSACCRTPLPAGRATSIPTETARKVMQPMRP